MSSGPRGIAGAEMASRMGATYRTVGARRNRPPVTRIGPYRGAQIWAITDTHATLRIAAGGACCVSRVVSLDLFTPSAGRALGDPVIVRVEEIDDDFVVIEVREGTFADGISDQAASVARGEFHPSRMTEAEGFDPVYRDPVDNGE